jgi:hypothetical protein
LSIGETVLSQAGVGHLKSMKKLHTLELGTVKYLTEAHHFPDFIITVAGEVPSLQNLGFNFADTFNQNQFIEEFAEKYPEKQLVVNKLSYVPLL